MQSTFKKIKSLEIQGAESIALAAVRALAAQATQSKAKTKPALIAELEKAAAFLASSRPTEPAMRNELASLSRALRESDSQGVQELKKLAQKKAQEYADFSHHARARIAEFGAKLVPQKGAVLVHCHSSAVMRVLKKAFDQGKRFEVFCTESRPFFQGRISSRELSEYGIPTTMIVDDSVNFFFSQKNAPSLVLVGADAITDKGELVNKIGTSLIALAAREAGAKVYSCTLLHKYDPHTRGGKSEPIEFRGEKELLSDLSPRQREAFKKIKILNPAFDITPANCISGVVTEKGVLNARELVSFCRKNFRV